MRWYDNRKLFFMVNGVYLFFVFVEIVYCAFLIYDSKIVFDFERFLILTALFGTVLFFSFYCVKKNCMAANIIYLLAVLGAFCVYKEQYYAFLFAYDRLNQYGIVTGIFCFQTISIFLIQKIKKFSFFKFKSFFAICIALLGVMFCYIYCFSNNYMSYDRELANEFYCSANEIAATDRDVLCIKNGKVQTADPNKNQILEEWKNVIKIEAKNDDIYGLTKEGKVLYCGKNPSIRSEVERWEQVEDIAAGSDYVVAINDGTLLIAGDSDAYTNEFDSNVDISSVKEIETVDCSILLLKDDGTILDSTNYEYLPEVKEWKNIEHISGGSTHLLGLQSNGVIRAAGEGFEGQCDVDGMKNVVYGYAGERSSVILRGDGSVVAVGEQKRNLFQVQKMLQIKAVVDTRIFTYVKTENGEWYGQK